MRLGARQRGCRGAGFVKCPHSPKSWRCRDFFPTLSHCLRSLWCLVRRAVLFLLLRYCFVHLHPHLKREMWGTRQSLSSRRTDYGDAELLVCRRGGHLGKIADVGGLDHGDRLSVDGAIGAFRHLRDGELDMERAIGTRRCGDRLRFATRREENTALGGEAVGRHTPKGQTNTAQTSHRAGWSKRRIPVQCDDIANAHLGTGVGDQRHLVVYPLRWNSCLRSLRRGAGKREQSKATSYCFLAGRGWVLVNHFSSVVLAALVRCPCDRWMSYWQVM